ncbi:putative calcium-binding protein CML46 [Salvia divinorum]|uniref:Calcium-binding protein CML46 n=1 Tax=Salvia divinorum TaxID=28513 RepID=A0ABD1H3P6_SALDI
MEKVASIVSNLLLLLFSSLFVDVEEFITRFRFFTRSLLIRPCDEQKSECKSQQPSKVREGTLSIAEVNMVMSRLGMEGVNGNPSVGIPDLAALFEEEEPSFDEIKETFSVFDADNDGFIDACDLRRVVSNLGVKESYDLEEYKRMIRAYDINGDGLIDFQEFLKFMEKCLC